MTSEARELSLEDGAPIVLVEFVRGTAFWRYAGAEELIEHAGHDFLPAAVSYSNITQGPETRKLSLTVKIPSDLAVAANWRPLPPSDVIGIVLMTKHDGEDDALVQWVGRVVNAEFDGGDLTLTCDPSSVSAQTSGSEAAFQPSCWKTLYSPPCGVSLEAHAVPATLGTVVGLILTSAAFLLFPSGRLAGGFIRWTRDDGIVETRGIDSHSGGTITISYGAGDLAPGLETTVNPACGQTWGDCEYYENTDNFGGEEWMPIKDPFAGDPP